MSKIKSRTTILGTLLLLTGLLTQTSLAEQDRFADVEIKTIKLQGNISMLVGAGGNIGVSAGPDGILMVDDQYAPLSEKISAALDLLGSGKPKYVINTHFHGDHTGSNEFFSSSGTVIAHQNVRLRLVDEEMPPAALPVITFDQKIQAHFNGEQIDIIHVPVGHTDGDSIVLFNSSNVAHLGDQFWNGLFPFIDLENGGTVQGYIANVIRSITLVKDDTQIIPGHGSLGSKPALERFLVMLESTTGIVKSLMQQGQSLKQIQQTGLGAEWDSWGVWFITEERWIETIYTSYSNERTLATD